MLGGSKHEEFILASARNNVEENNLHQQKAFIFTGGM
jgi:hypothetical protein